MTQRKNPQLKKVTHSSIKVHEPRYVERKPLALIRFSIFPTIQENEDDMYIDEQLSHAIYDIEIANSISIKKELKK